MIGLPQGLVSIAAAGGPIPWEDLEGPCATAWWWPEATKRMQSHTSQFIVAVRQGEITRLHRRIVLTHVVRAVCANSDAVGVYWGEGTLVHDPGDFIRESSHMTAEDFSIRLWVDIRIERNADQTRRCFTTGLVRFGLKEIEIQSTTMNVEDLYFFVVDVATYIVANDLNFKDGATVGPSDEVQYDVRHAPSMFDRDEVLLIDLP